MRNAQRSNPIISLNQRVPFVCFDCRIAHKHWIPFYFDEYGPYPQRKDRPLLWRSNRIFCPNCRESMAFLGRYFKAPKKNDERQWLKIEILWAKGWAADGANCVRNLDSPRDAKNLEIEERAVLVRQSKAEKRAARLETLRRNRPLAQRKPNR